MHANAPGGGTNAIGAGQDGAYPVATSGGSTANAGGGQSHDHTLSANFSGSANSVLQPYFFLIYIIKT